MAAACADRMDRGDCGDCARVERCKALFAQLFGLAPPPQRRRCETERPFETSEFSLRALLGSFAQAMEIHAPASMPTRRSRPRRPPQEGSFGREIERRIEPLLERGPVRIEEVARALGCSRQTLYRRLKEEDLTFAELLDDLRRRLGLHYVRERGMAVKEAAYRLGFSEPAAFSRAYKRWTGSSPRQLDS